MECCVIILRVKSSMSSTIKVITGPVRVGSVIARVVKFPDNSGRVEVWKDGAWVTGRENRSPDFADMLNGEPMSPAELKEAGIAD